MFSFLVGNGDGGLQPAREVSAPPPPRIWREPPSALVVMHETPSLVLFHYRPTHSINPSRVAMNLYQHCLTLHHPSLLTLHQPATLCRPSPPSLYCYSFKYSFISPSHLDHTPRRLVPSPATLLPIHAVHHCIYIYIPSESH